MRISITLNHKNHKELVKRAQENKRSISKEAQALIQKGMLLDVPERKSQIAMACSIESLMLQRHLAEQMINKEFVKKNNQEALEIVQNVLLEDEPI